MAMDKRIEECRDEGDREWFVYLKPGYRVRGGGTIDNEQHCFGAESKTEIRQIMRDEVEPCDCRECKPNG